MLNKALFTSATAEWATPKALFNELNAEFHFDLDPCATPENAKCKDFYTADIDGLTQNWGGAESVLQSSLWEVNIKVGQKKLGGIPETGNVGCYADTRTNRYGILSRLHLPQSPRNPFYPWKIAF